MRDNIWIGVAEWELVAAGDALAHWPRSEGERPHWLGLAESRHTTSIVGVGSGPRTISAERSKRVTTHFRIVFKWDKDYEKRLQHEDRNDPEPNFGMYARDVAQLDIIAPVSERTWYVDCLSKHRQPLVKADLERRSETSEAWDVVSYSLFSDRRAVERAEKR